MTTALPVPTLAAGPAGLTLEGVALADIAERFGTPTYVYSRAALTGAYHAYQKALGMRKALVCYAVQANPRLGLLSVFAKLGAGFALAVLLSANIVRMAFYLVMSLAATSGLFFLAGQEFVGAMQLLIYVGGTLVLLIFGVMLTSQERFVNMKTLAGDWVIGMIAGGALLIDLFPQMADLAEQPIDDVGHALKKRIHLPGFIAAKHGALEILVVDVAGSDRDFFAKSLGDHAILLDGSRFFCFLVHLTAQLPGAGGRSGHTRPNGFLKPMFLESPQRCFRRAPFGSNALAQQGEIFAGLRSQAGGAACLLYTSPSPRDRTRSRMPSSA